MMKIDYNYCINDIVGKNGISLIEIEKIKNKVEKAHKKIINSEIGFIELLENIDLENIKLKVKSFKERFKNLIVLGIGGSALGAKAIYHALEKKSERNLIIADNIDPDFLSKIFNDLDLNNTCFAVISKSGATTETISQFLIVLDNLKKNFKENLMIITDPEKGGLREFANKFEITSFEIPQNLGGRYSVLSPVGLVPLYFVDIDIDKLIKGAKSIKDRCLKFSLSNNPAYISGIIQYICFQRGKNISVLFAYSRFLEYFVEWYKQLWAESLGKEDKFGLTPLKAIGVTDQHSLLQLFMEGPDDKIITFLKIKKFKHSIKIPELEFFDRFSYLYGKSLNDIFNFELESVKIALAKKGRINYTIEIDEINEFYLGQLIFYFMVKTAFTGFLFGIDPFNQPGVEEGKNFTYGLMGRNGFEEKRKEFYEFLSKTSDKYIA